MSDMNRSKQYPKFDMRKRRIFDKSSPCIRNCCLDENDICVGCFRSIDEIMHWSRSSDAEKKEVLIRADVRKKASGQS